MNVMVILILASLVVAIGFLIAFIWFLRKGQFDDLHTPAIRMLFENNSKSKDVDKIGERQ